MSTELKRARSEAREWLLRLSSGLADEGEYASFKRWLETDVTNQREFGNICQLWGELDLARSAMLTEAPAPVTPTHRPVLRWAMAACLLMALVVWGSLGLYPGNESAALAPALYSTDRGQTRELTLPDGSEVSLGAYSRLRVSYEPAERRLTLLRGEAFFKVAHQISRPFRVTAEGVTTTAVGTAFNVNLGSAQVRVEVAEGQVELSSAAGPESLHLSAGEAAGYRKDGSALPVRKQTAQLASQWREGRREYYQAPLRELVNDLNRYSEAPIILTSRKLGDTQITAAFEDFTVVASVLQAVEDALPARVVQTASGIHIRAR